VHAARWEASFRKKRDDVEKLEIQKQRRADRRGQGLLHWDAEHTDNLIHMSRDGARTVRNRRRLEAQDTIPPSDSEESDEDLDRACSSVDTVENDGDAVHEEALAPDDSNGTPLTRKKTSPPPDPYFLLPLGDRELGCCSEGLLRPSVLRVLYRAWTDTRSAVAAWLADRDLGRTGRVAGEAVLEAWMREDSACAF
jgi:hypothetical protein